MIKRWNVKLAMTAVMTVTMLKHAMSVRIDSGKDLESVTHKSVRKVMWVSG